MIHCCCLLKHHWLPQHWPLPRPIAWGLLIGQVSTGHQASYRRNVHSRFATRHLALSCQFRKVRMSFMAGCRAGLEVVSVEVGQSFNVSTVKWPQYWPVVVCLCGQWTFPAVVFHWWDNKRMMTGYKMKHKDTQDAPPAVFGVVGGRWLFSVISLPVASVSP